MDPSSPHSASGQGAPNGQLFLTAFLEEGVPDVEENPVNYLRRWSGPLHCVRYNREAFRQMAEAAGFRLDRLEPRAETDGQTAVYLSRAGGS